MDGVQMRRIAKYTFFSLVIAVAICAPRATHLRGHTGDHPWAVFSPDARYIASVSHSDHTVRIWDGAIREQLAVVPENCRVSYVAFSPDSKLLALGGEDKVTTVRKVANGEEVIRFAGHASTVRGIAFNPDGRTITTGEQNGTVKVWELATGREVLTIRTRHEFLTELAFSPDGKFLASGGSPGRGREIQIWDAKTGAEHRSLNRPGGYLWVNRLLFSPDGETLCATDQEGFSLWDVATGQERYCAQPKWLDEDDIYVDVVAFGPDGRTLAAGHEKTIGLWDTASGRNTRRFPKDDSDHHLHFTDRFLMRPDRPDLDPDIMAVAFRPNGDLMAVGSQVCTPDVVMWRVTSVPQKK
jgi:WD40 repeat protein